ncbi:hypothetical protein ACFVTY_31725 [Streptomyces sp. NPDC058067]|uniref:hypothetical protein n=1 Tax=Streptomyces sp. NPDC058067 TaxID=3346324 RepID=UPI0036EB42F7
MSNRALPPPPPPVHLRTWPDRHTLLTDRGMALAVLRTKHLGVGRLLLLWLCGAGAMLGWALLSLVIQQFEDKDPLVFVMGPVFAILGLAALIPSVIGVALGIRRDRKIRELTDAWLALDSDPVSDARLRAPGASLAWLLSSVVLCALGLWASLGVAATAEPGRDTYGDVAFGMGAGLVMWLTGLVGIVKAVGYYRWALRSRGAPTTRGAHR